MGDIFNLGSRKRSTISRIFQGRIRSRRSWTGKLRLLAMVPLLVGVGWLVRQPVVKNAFESLPLGGDGDDLKEIEGIGPKSESVLRKAGITSYRRLAKADVQELKDILKEAGMTSIDPSTWPEQADKAARGDMQGLYKLRDQLRGGRRV
jgi:hypothetical protein